MGPPPTTQTSSDALPHTPLNDPVSGGLVSPAMVAHAVPVQCRIVPPSPIAQTSFGPLPHTPASDRIVPTTATDQTVPFQCKIAPLVPAVQMSLGPLPHTARMRPAVFATLVTVDQVAPV